MEHNDLFFDGKQFFIHFENWEDFQNGMYKTRFLKDNDPYIAAVTTLFKNPKLLEITMQQVCDEWQVAAMINLTNNSINKRAWLGQAAGCKYAGAPEIITRIVWNELSDGERLTANKIAEKIISLWIKNHILNYVQETLSY